MRWLLDTSIAVTLIRRRVQLARTRYEAALRSAEGIGIPSPALFELWYGVCRSDDPARHQTLLEAFLSPPLVILNFSPEDARIAGDLRAGLEHAGQRIGPYDLLIAAQALRLGATLVTGNTREFSRVPGLAVEDWSV